MGSGEYEVFNGGLLGSLVSLLELHELLSHGFGLGHLDVQTTIAWHVTDSLQSFVHWTVNKSVLGSFLGLEVAHGELQWV